MLLFSDGFETYNIYDVGNKWGGFSWTGTTPMIASGIEPSTGKPYATKNGRALYVGNAAATLGTTFRPSRTIFAGFALRTRAAMTITIHYLANRTIARDNLRPLAAAGSVSALTLTISAYRIAISQTFVGATTKVGDINTSMNMLSGDYHYIQVGMTLTGNESAQPRAWMEVRVGNEVVNRFRYDSILTSAPDNTGTYSYLNGLQVGVSSAAGTAIDDVYICNDEGDFNNTFLGTVRVRRMVPVADGIDLDAVPTLRVPDARRFQAVDEDFIDVTHALPSPIPTDPLFITWEDGVADYLTLEQQGDRESIRFTGGEFGGSSPEIFGAVLHTLARGKYRDRFNGTVLKGYKRQGEFPEIEEATPADFPLNHSPTALTAGGWQNYPLAFDNTEIVAPGQPYQIWSVAGIAGAEFGIELSRSEIDPAMLDPNLNRFNLVFDHALYEGMHFSDTTHRFFEDPIDEALGVSDTDVQYQYTWHFEESLYFDVELSVYRTFPKFLHDEIEFDDFMPWLDSFVGEFLGLTEDIWLQWLDVVEDGFDVADWTDGFWEELFTDEIGASDAVAADFILFLEDTFGLEEPYVWNGHEDIVRRIPLPGRWG
jgi:hypothetical protein